MALPSSSQEKYEVFLSFRGEDTRDGFTGYLYQALCQKHILTYKDDENLQIGRKISEIMEAIRKSKICIIVFSKDFASSTWCLDEVARILECKRDGNDDTIIPIFYGIEPSIVRKQADTYAEAFAKHELLFKNKTEKVQQWRDALKEVAALSGYDSKNFRPEYKFVEKIVEDILLKLSEHRSTNDHFKNAIGIDNRIKEIKQLLCIGSMDVRIIGLHGMGGIGKTTLARAVFRDLYPYFESYCFLKNVREESEKHGINHLRKNLLFQLFKDKTIQNMESTYIQERFCRTKVLIILDDLDDAISQLNELLPKEYEFGVGSRIIVTTRDAQMLKSRTDKIYEVKRLDYFEALELFRLHAFGQNSDPDGYETLSEKVASCADGNPLALEVLGSSLSSKSVKEWQSILDELQTEPNKNIQQVLRISFDKLGNKDKKGYTGIQGVFLDLACFFSGEVDRESVESILHRENSDATIKISVLIDRCLINEYQKKLSMHALLRQMGKAIVCGENKEPGNRTRLWMVKDVCHVLEKNTGTSEIEGISMNQAELKKDVKVRPTTFSKMYHLRFLRMHFDDRFDHKEILFEKLGWAPYDKEMCKQIYFPSEGIEYLSDELRYFQWDLYPLKYLPSNFSPENLVELVMRDSQLVELDLNGDEPIGKLKKMDLSFSEHLIQIPNLYGAINLDSINLEGCTSLVQVPSCFKNLDKLQFLDLGNCENLKDGIENLPLNIRELILCGTAIEVVPSSIGSVLGLHVLDLHNCKRLKSLSVNIWKLKYLEWLNLCYCPNLEKLPEIQDCVSSSLHSLYISGCTRLKSIPELPSSLSCLYADNCTSLETISSWRARTAQEIWGEESCATWTKYNRRHIYNINVEKGDIYVFEDCIKLDHNTRNNVIADRARCRILSAQHDISVFETVYPGDGIPEWFSHQTDDAWNSIHIQLPSNWFSINDPRFHFVFSTIFVTDDPSQPHPYIQFEFIFKTNIESVYRYHARWLPRNMKPDHIFIEYQRINLASVFGVNWSSICSNVTEVSFRMILDRNDSIFKIKKVGLELLNKFGANKRRFGECFGGQPDGYQDKNEDSHLPQINSKRRTK